MLGSWAAINAQNVINEPPALTKMIDNYTRQNKSVETVKAWTIQIAVSTDRRKVESEQSRFGRIFPEHRLAWEHDNPYYKLKLRDVAYLRKMDALNLLHQIKRRSTAAAILIREDVSPEKILQSAL